MSEDHLLPGEKIDWGEPRRRKAKAREAAVPAPGQPEATTPEPDVTCEHGTALDVHCCNCYNGAARIQSRCICRSWNPRECYRLRYHTLDDMDFDDDDCCCGCHDELRELERDIYGDPDFEGDM